MLFICLLKRVQIHIKYIVTEIATMSRLLQGKLSTKVSIFLLSRSIVVFHREAHPQLCFSLSQEARESTTVGVLHREARAFLESEKNRPVVDWAWAQFMLMVRQTQRGYIIGGLHTE